jgi:hypothetical protein
MAIAKEDIKPGWYWVRYKPTAYRDELGIVHVRNAYRDELWVFEPGSDNDGNVDQFLADGEQEFIARIEPPEGV